MPVSRMFPAASFLAVACLSAVVTAQSPSPEAQRMLDDVRVLASDEYEGRGVGTEGLRKAGEYIAAEFRQAGLNVTSEEGDPFQDFSIADGARLGRVTTLSLTAPDGTPLPGLVVDQNFRACSFGGTGKFNGGLAFVGYGIQDNDSGYNDFAGIDVRGKVVIIVRRNPFQDDPQGAFSASRGASRHSALTTKLSRASSQGAIAVLLVNDPKSVTAAAFDKAEQVARELQNTPLQPGVVSPDAFNGDKPSQTSNQENLNPGGLPENAADELFEFGYGGTRSGRAIPCFQIKQSVCNQILRAALGKSLEDIETEIDSTKKPYSRDLAGWKASGETSIESITIPARNVIGVLEGAGPLSEETIIIGAHYDHLGRGGEGSLLPGSKEIHNGADDNASGTAGLLEMARRLGKLPQPPARRIVFIAFAGEERGLLGSEHYVEHPLFPLEKTVAMFNMDMIGRAEEGRVTVFGTGTSSVWTPRVDAANEIQKLAVSRKPEGFGPSDHSTFYGKEIPVLHLFTGTHSDYHRPSDDWERINASDMVRIVNLLEGVVLATVNAPQRPDYIRIQGSAILDRGGNRPYFGSIPDFSSEVEGYALQGVSPGSPAERGGLQAKDIIIRLGDKKIAGLEDFDLALRDFRAGQEVQVVVKRGAEEVTLKVQLSRAR